MTKKKKIFIFLLLLLTIYFFINYTIGNERFNLIKHKFPNDFKIVVKKYLFPFKFIKEREKYILEQEQLFKNTIKKNKKEINKLEFIKNKIYLLDVYQKNNLEDFVFKKTDNIDIKPINKILKIYNPYKNIIYTGITHFFPGSAYLEFYENKLFLLSSIGIIGYSEIDEEKFNFRQIKNNIDNFIDVKQFKKSHEIGSSTHFSTKDLKIYNNKVLVSYTNELKENCWNTSIIVADLNLKELKFKKLFQPNECVHSLKNKDNEFTPFQSGGRIVKLDNDTIFLSVGDYRSRYLSQDTKSIFGKIIKININNGNYKIISSGHRNPQGLYYDINNNFLLSTEHGPQGGDEVNLIKLNQNKIQNYGWPVASYGEHYGDKNKKENQIKYKKYPLLKSHKDNGFIEPLKFFSKSIGVSEITSLGNLGYLFSSLKEESLYFFNLNKKKQIQEIKKFNIGERVRDLATGKNKIFLFLESTASIGVIDLK